MCTLIYQTILICQNTSILPSSFNYSTLLLLDSPKINMSSFPSNLRQAVFLNYVPSCYQISKLQIDTIPTCSYKFPHLPPKIINTNNFGILLYLLLLLLIIYILSCIHMQIKIKVRTYICSVSSP